MIIPNLRKEHLSDKQALVLGMGFTGSSVCEALIGLGVHVRSTDSRSIEEIPETVKKLSAIGVETITGGHSINALEAVDFIVCSPSISDNLPVLLEAQKRQIPIFTEIDLAFQLCQSRLIAITGTNGKSTTCRLVGELLQIPVANAEISSEGSALIKLVTQPIPPDMLVVEIKSFQLSKLRYFRPTISVLLNINEDHTNKFGSLVQYGTVKRRIFKDQTGDDIAILNYDDKNVMFSNDSIDCRRLFFSAYRRALPYGVWVAEDKIVSNITGNKQIIDVVKWRDVKLSRRLYSDSVLASIVVALVEGVSLEQIKKVVSQFSNLPHRLEYVAEIDGISFYNDAKSKNPSATLKAIDCLNTSVVLIAGGETKGIDFTILRSCISSLRGLVLIEDGSATDVLLQIAKSVKLPNIAHANSMADAVRIAKKWALSGDAVLLSPASDCGKSFKNFDERGNQFIAAVEHIINHRNRAMS